jgi:hypothetical protein
MRGHVDPQSAMFSYFSIEERVPADHPLRRIKADADVVLKGMGPAFDAMYAAVGRVSVANSYSGWNRCVKQPTTMLLPSILAKSSTRGRWG